MENHIDKFNRIKSEWHVFKSKSENKKIRIRNAADALNTTEANLLSTEIGKNATYLKINDYKSLLEDLLQIDKLMLLIRTDYVVHELIIETSNVNITNKRLFYKDQNSSIIEYNLEIFQYAFFENKKHGKKDLKSFQLFDKYGTSLLKIYLKGFKSELFDKIALKYKSDYKYEIQKNDDKKNQHGINKNPYNSDTSNNNTLREILDISSNEEIPLEINAFGNQITQYYSGKIKNIVDFGPWINIIDKSFNLHVLEKCITRNIVKYDKENKLFIIDLFDKSNDRVLEIKLKRQYEANFTNILKNSKG
tara:strand:- start:7757 stop:8674 length:918 start_codon:yes stop_codon:yes gene_type:complete